MAELRDRVLETYGLKPEDVAEVVATIATRPPGVNLNQVVMRPLVPREFP